MQGWEGHLKVAATKVGRIQYGDGSGRDTGYGVGIGDIDGGANVGVSLRGVRVEGCA